MIASATSIMKQLADGSGPLSPPEGTAIPPADGAQSAFNKEHGIAWGLKGLMYVDVDVPDFFLGGFGTSLEMSLSSYIFISNIIPSWVMLN